MVPWGFPDPPRVCCSRASFPLVFQVSKNFPAPSLLFKKNKTKVFKLNYTRVYGNSVIRGNNGITPLSKIYFSPPFQVSQKNK